MTAAQPVARLAGQVRRAMVGLLDSATQLALAPVVHPWMTCEGASVRDLARQLDGHLERFDAASARTRDLRTQLDAALGAGPSAAGWSPPLQPAPEGSSAPEAAPPDTASGVESPWDETAFVQLRGALVGARDALLGLADALDEHGPPLRAAALAMSGAVAHVATDALTEPGVDLAELRRLRSVVRGHTDALSRADVECRRGLELAIRAAPEGSALIAAALPTAAAGPGLTEPVTGDVLAGESASGEAGTAGPVLADAAAVASAPVAPDPEQPVRGLRRALVARSAADVHAYLRRHPGVIERLVADRGDLDLLPAGLSAELTAPPTGADPAVTLRAIEDRHAAFAAAPDEGVRAGLLWPSLVGPLDGAGVAARVAANRLLVRAELGRARRADIDLELRAIARRVADASSPLRALRGLRDRVISSWLTRDAITSFVTASTDLPRLVRADLRIRILLYESLLYDRVPDPEATAGWTNRRLLLFDGSGRGRLAELWGHLDASTQAVAVLVPGTGTAVRGFHLPTQVARDLAAALAAPAGPSLRAAVIAWMGADFPLAIGTNAPFAHYALAAASPLRDFVAGLPRPTHAALTVLGHSYGGTMVGAAERVGLACDRVVQVASPGAGPGVRGVDDYPGVDPLGRPRAPRRFSLTAPGDPIRWAQRFEAPWQVLPRAVGSRVRGRFAGLSLGVDPERLRGVTVLPAGTWEVARGIHEVGAPLAGPSAHAGVMTPGTGAFRALTEVVGAPP